MYKMIIIAGGKVKCLKMSHSLCFMLNKQINYNSCVYFGNWQLTRLFLSFVYTQILCKFNVWAVIWGIFSYFAVEQVIHFLLSSRKVQTWNWHHLIGKVQMMNILLGTFYAQFNLNNLWIWLQKLECIKWIEVRMILKQNKQLCSRHDRGEWSHYHCNNTVNNRS